MMIAFEVILLVVLVICGLGAITDVNKKNYLTTYGVTGVLFLLAMVVEIFN